MLRSGDTAPLVLFLLSLAWVSPLGSHATVGCPPQSSDPCCIPATGSIYTSRSRSYPVSVTSLTKVRSCLRGLQQMPFALKSDIVDSLQLKLKNMYAFLDISRNSSDSDPCSVPYPLHQLAYDPTPVFQAALATTSSVDFYQGLSRAFRRFNDAHTRFFSPLQVFHYLRPMVLSTRLRKSPTAPATQEVYLSAINPLYTLLNATRLVPHLATWSALIGRTVNTINGQPALAYLTAQANNYGFHKSPGVRFNQLLKQTYFSVGEHDIPASDKETYGFGNDEFVDAPLVAVVSDPRLANGTAQLSQYIQSEHDTVVNSVALSRIIDLAVDYNEAVTLAQLQTTWPLRSSNLSYGNTISVFELDDALVLKLPGAFGISDSNSFFVEALTNTYLRLNAYAQANGIDTLLLDVIGTNGGSLAFTNWLLGALVGPEYQTDPTKLCETYDIKVAEVWNQWAASYAVRPWVNVIGKLTVQQMEEIYDTVVVRNTEFMQLFDTDLSSFYPTDVLPQLVHRLQLAMTSSSNQSQQLIAFRDVLLNFFSRPPYSLITRNIEWYPLTQRRQPIPREPEYANLSYYRNPRTYTRGGITAPYSQKFFQSCVSALASTHSLWRQVRKHFKNIFFLTDGTCGGACALLLSKLQIEKRARVASFGGILNQPADTSFAGGYIENWPEEFEKVRVAELLGNLIFQVNDSFPALAKLPVPATFTIAAYELYLSRLGQCALPRDWYNIPGDVNINLWATRLDTWPTPQHATLLQLYRDTIRGFLPAATTSVPATTGASGGLSGGTLTAILIVSIAILVVVTIGVYVYIRKRQQKPLLGSDEAVRSEAPLLEGDRVSLNDNELWPEQE